jgi:hypothetical protein
MDLELEPKLKSQLFYNRSNYIQISNTKLIGLIYFWFRDYIFYVRKIHY